MSLPRRFAIAEESHRILDPMTPEMLDELGRAIRLREGMTMLDLGCGKAEALCQWSVQHGIRGTGVDVNPPFVDAARRRADELGVGDRVTIVERDATGYVADSPVDVAACIGATWIGDGTLGTLELLSRSLRPDGVALVGECYWREVPTSPEAVTGSGAEHVEDFKPLWELIADLQGAGWDVVEMMHADEHSWDRYVAAQWLNLRRFIDANPDDELVPELRAELEAEPVRYTRWQRRHLGWAVFALMRKP